MRKRENKHACVHMSINNRKLKADYIIMIFILNICKTNL